MKVNTQDWRGQWMSLHDLSSLMEKSYKTVHRIVSDGADGITAIRCGGRVWVKLSPTAEASMICNYIP